MEAEYVVEVWTICILSAFRSFCCSVPILRGIAHPAQNRDPRCGSMMGAVRINRTNPGRLPHRYGGPHLRVSRSEMQANLTQRLAVRSPVESETNLSLPVDIEWQKQSTDFHRAPSTVSSLTVRCSGAVSCWDCHYLS